MFYRPAPLEGSAWYQGSDTAWGAYIAAVYAAAVKRGEDESAEGSRHA